MLNEFAGIRKVSDEPLVRYSVLFNFGHIRCWDQCGAYGKPENPDPDPEPESGTGIRNRNRNRNWRNK